MVLLVIPPVDLMILLVDLPLSKLPYLFLLVSVHLIEHLLEILLLFDALYHRPLMTETEREVIVDDLQAVGAAKVVTYLTGSIQIEIGVGAGRETGPVIMGACKKEKGIVIVTEIEAETETWIESVKGTEIGGLIMTEDTERAVEIVRGEVARVVDIMEKAVAAEVGVGAEAGVEAEVEACMIIVLSIEHRPEM